MSTKAKWRNGILTFFDSSTFETVKPCSAIELYDDFIGTLNTNIWTVIDSGAETELKVANQHGGVFELLFTTANEKQIPGVALGDNLEFNIDKGTIFEARVAIQTLPTLLAEFFFGISGIHADGTVSTGDGPLIHAFFLFDGSGEAFVRTDDGTIASAIVTTGVTVLAGAYHIFRIDMTTVTDIKFYIDGVAVATGTTFDMNTGSPNLQPYFRGHKASDVGVATVGALRIDYVRIWDTR